MDSLYIFGSLLRLLPEHGNTLPWWSTLDYILVDEAALVPDVDMML